MITKKLRTNNSGRKVIADLKKSAGYIKKPSKKESLKKEEKEE